MTNSFFDSLVRPRTGVFRRRLSGFRLCAYAGLFAGTALGVVLVVNLRLSLWVVPILALSITLSLYVLAVATKIVMRVEKLVFYHHMIFTGVICALVLKAMGQPVPAYLDVLALSLGAFHVCARIGCLIAACCHGRPSRWGVNYQPELMINGLPSYLVGVRLFPVQALESLWNLCIVIVGSIVVFNGAQPGEGFSWYVIAYGTGRFFLEFARGDVERPYFWSFSEAQWTSLLLVCGLALSELSGLLVFHAWHIAVAGVIAMTMMALAASRKVSMSRA